MGTPFPDHYSAFFSFFGIISFFYALETKRKMYWFLIPIFFFLAFFCKQTPAAYVILLFTFIFFLFAFYNKNFRFLIPIIYGSILSLILLFAFIWIYDVDIQSFFNQYFLYPRNIGSIRIAELDLTFNKAISTFKFVHFIFLILLFIFINRIIIKKKDYLSENNFFINLSIILFTISLIFHQWLTLNFIFIFFIIPIICALIQSNLKKIKFSKWFNVFLIIFCLSVTTKYHFRFNEERKMLNLENINLSNYYETSNLTPKLKGLKWITREYSQNTIKEIEKLFVFKKILENETKNDVYFKLSIFLSNIE